jgi:DNA-binding LacI/PurR family transcriptional regulator
MEFTLLTMRRVTLRDIAEKANVSHVTVSMALRKHPKISIRTRERIQKLADQMGYVPDPALGRLNAYRRGFKGGIPHSVLAWINLWKDPKGLDAYYTYHLYREGADKQAAVLGYRIEEFRLGTHELSLDRFVGILKSRGITGLLIPPFPEGLHSMLELPWAEYSTVRFGHSGSFIPSHSVSNSQYQTAFDAIEICIKKGYRSIGYFFNKGGEKKTRSKFLGGYLAGCYSYETAKQIPPLITQSSSIRDHKNIFMEWFRMYRPEVVFTQHEEVYIWLTKEGLRVPEDVKIVHLALPIKSSVKFAGMHQNSYMIGVQAVNLLDRLLRHAERGIPEVPVQVNLASEWIDGDTA